MADEKLSEKKLKEIEAISADWGKLHTPLGDLTQQLSSSEVAI